MSKNKIPVSYKDLKRGFGSSSKDKSNYLAPQVLYSELGLSYATFVKKIQLL